MPAILCDICDSEPGRLMVGDQETGDQTSWGLACMPLLGLSLVKAMPDEMLDATLKELGYAPTKATRDARKAAQLPEYPISESVLDVVESGPRTEGDESTSNQGDQSPDPLVDKGTVDDGDDPVSPATKAFFDQARNADKSPGDDDDDLPPY